MLFIYFNDGKKENEYFIYSTVCMPFRLSDCVPEVPV